MNEKRNMERFSLYLPSVISVIREDENQDAIELNTCNVCAGGVFFKTRQKLPVGTEVKVDMILPLDELRELKGKRSLVKVSGEVIRVENDGMAIRFDKKYKILPLPKQT